MTCESVRDRLGEWVVGAEAEDVAAHVDACRACAGEADDLRELTTRLAELPRRIEKRPEPRRRWSAFLPAAAAAIVFLAIAAFIVARPAPQAGGGTPAAPQDAREEARALRQEVGRLSSVFLRTTIAKRPAPEDLPKLAASVRTRAARVPAEHRAPLVRASVLTEMALWDVREKDRFEAARGEFTKEQWVRLERALLGEPASPEELQRVAFDIFEEARAAARNVLHAAEPPAPAPVELQVRVTNFYKAPDGSIYMGADWTIVLAKGDKLAVARRHLQTKSDGYPDRIGEIDQTTLAAALADLTKKGVLTVKDGQACRCDAPQYEVTAVDGEKRHTFTLGHAHDDHDAPQRAIVDAIIKLVEEHATDDDRK